MPVPDGRYLMQIRDHAPGILYPGYTCLFGGGIEGSESPEDALRRELMEELRFTPHSFFYVTELVYPRILAGATEFVRDTYFLVPITPDDLDRMELCEGEARRLMSLGEIVARKVVPWDICGLLYHATGVLRA